MQGDPLSIVAYGIVILPMIKPPKSEYPDIIHTWYADDAGALGTSKNTKLYFNFSKRFVPGCGYYPKPPKRVLIVHLDNLEGGKQFGLHHGFKVRTGAH